MADDDKKKPAEKKPADKAPKGGGDGGEKKEKKSRKAGGGAAALAKPVTATPQDRVEPRLKKRYESEVVANLTRQFGYTSRMQVPRVQKITVNMGLGEAVANAKIIDSGVTEVTAITGQ